MQKITSFILASAAVFAVSSAIGQESEKRQDPEQNSNQVQSSAAPNPSLDTSSPESSKQQPMETTEVEGLKSQTAETSSTIETEETAEAKNLSTMAIGAVATGLGLALAGGGGGGGGGVGGGGGGRSHSYSDSASGAFLTEYNAQSGLGRINARNLNDYNYTGFGIRLAIVDSGIASSHQEFLGRTINGTDFAATSGGHTADVNGHGTHVASIAAGNRDSVGMRGFAYDSTLYSYRIGNDAGSLTGVDTDAKWAQVVNRHTTDAIKVSNNSWGSSSSITSFTEAQLRATYPLTIAAYQSAVSNGTIFVWAAGNSGRTQVTTEAGLPYRITGLSDGWLAVVAVNSSNVETAYTNRCGVAADWCVTAPGGGDNQAADGIYAAQSGGTYVRLSGTSMAAPHVSGLLAALAEKFPELTSAQLVSRVKTTASLSGLTSTGGCTISTCSDATMRAIFGHGLVNGQAAMARIGNYIYPKDGNILLGQTIDLGKQQLSLPTGLTKANRQMLLSQQFKAFDSFDGATFQITGRELFNQQPPVTQMIGYAASTGNVMNHAATPKFGITSSEKLGNGSRMTFSQSDRSLGSSGADFWEQKLSLIPTVIDRSGVRRSTLEYSFPIRSNLTLVPFFVTAHQIQPVNAGVSAVWKLTNRTNLITTYSTGKNEESRSIHSKEGSAGLDRSTALSAGIRHKFSESFEAFGHISKRSISDSDSSTETWGYQGAAYSSSIVGLEYSLGTSKIAFGALQPEQISKGNLSIIVPSGRLTDGTVVWREQSYSLVNMPRYIGFFAMKHQINKRNNSEIQFQLQQSSTNLNRLDRATVSFTASF
jgi:subtilase-type serine protease